MLLDQHVAGQTNFIKELIQQSKKHIYFQPKRIIWCYSEWQPLYTSLLRGSVEFHQGLLQQLNLKVGKFCDYDYLISSMDQSFTNLPICDSYHMNISVIHILQIWFYLGKCHPTKKSQYSLSGPV